MSRVHSISRWLLRATLLARSIALATSLFASLHAAAPAAHNHWAFQPLRPPQIPPADSSAPPHPIDAFIRAALARQNFTPAPEADRATLLRRLSFDLTGLPPSPEEVDAFLSDHSPDAYLKVVNRLLDSPHYGERWARWWLDAARYADSNGFEKDRTRSIWPYRDWVIRAFNEDKSFDQFTLEQLAGDLLPNASLSQRVATGFLRNSMLNEEGGIEPEKFRTDAMIDRVDAVGRTWLALTIGCGQCHDHKYDPISQKEYYRFWSLLNQDDEPRIEVPTPEQAAQRTAILQKVDQFERDLAQKVPEFSNRFRAWLESVRQPLGSWTVIDTSEWHSTPMKFEKQEDLSFLGGGDIKAEGTLRFWWETKQTQITGFRLETMTNGNLAFGGPGLDGDGTFQLAELELEATPFEDRSKTNRIRFARAAASMEAENFPASQAIDGITTNGGWAGPTSVGRRNRESRLVVQTAEPIGASNGLRFRFTLHQSPKGSPLNSRMIGRFRLSYTTQTNPIPADPLTPEQRAWLDIPEAQRTPAQTRELTRLFLWSAPELASFARDWDALWKEWPAADTTLGLTARWRPRRTFVFKRGDYLKPTAEVDGGVPAALHPFPSNAPKNRLGLARWINDPTNPLTPRVLVNRIWQAHFGAGLVTTPEDFGTRADPPSHPELLDWLASEFLRTGSSLKALHRLIVTSHTYRQSSHIPPQLLEADPLNRWLARAPRFRLDAEMIQDSFLKAAGLLSPKIGGPSVFPPLPDGVMQMSFGPIPWNISEGDDRYRRALYTFWKRSVPYPAMVSFDAPVAEQSCVRRTRSNTPLQALVTLNEPTLNNAARWLAWRTLSSGGAHDADRARYAFRQCLGRSPDAQEISTLLKLKNDGIDDFSKRPRDAAAFAFADPKNPPPLPPGATVNDLAAWTAVTRVILNLDETITKE